MANKSTVAQPPNEGNNTCGCCDSISSQVHKGWEVGLPLWRNYNFIHCEPCGRIWSRIRKHTSHWREISEACPQKLRQRKGVHIKVFGDWKPEAIETTVSRETSDDKIIQFPSSTAA